MIEGGPAALASAPRCFLHGDIQTTNMLVCAGVPLRAVLLLLQGYREVVVLDHDTTAEARILWRHLQLALLVLRRGPLPGRSWAERPLAMLLEIMRFMIESPAGVWRDLLG